MASRKKQQVEIDLERLGEVSHTELVQIAALMGLRNITRKLPAETLIEMILYGQDGEDPVSRERNLIFTFVDRNRRVIRASELDCDLDCKNCRPMRVLQCFTTNRDMVEI